MHQFGSETVEVLLLECEMVLVLIIQERLREYRLPLYEKLATALRHDGVRLRVAYSLPSGGEDAVFRAERPLRGRLPKIFAAVRG